MVGPNAGKFVDAQGNLATHKVGDILVVSDFSNGGGTSFITVYEWVGSGGDTNGTLQTLGGGDNKRCGTQANDPFCGIVNPTNGTISPWPFLDKSGNTTFLNGELFEGGVNLSALSAAVASECFASFLSETRSSTSATSTLKDFVLGRFAPCTATMSTTPSGTTVLPGQPVTDTATVIGSVASKTPTGNVTFFLCTFPVGSNEVCDGTVNHGTQVGSPVALSGSGGTATATSAPVNTAASPLDAGHYCFFASWPGDSNYTDALTADAAGECFDVIRIPTTTVTTPSAGSGGTVSFGSSVTDHAVITATTAGDGTPTGSVSFFVCDPTQTSGGACPSPNGTAVGSPVTTTAVVGSNPPSSQADSAAVTVNKTGTWCFRAVYTPSGANGNNYLGSSDASSGECFTVNDTTSATSAQTWLPNDTGTVQSAHGAPLNGTLSFTLFHSGDCTGTILRAPESFSIAGVSSATKTTTNTTVAVSVTDAVSWLVMFTSNDANVAPSTHCENTSLIITN